MVDDHSALFLKDKKKIFFFFLVKAVAAYNISIKIMYIKKIKEILL